MRTYCSLIICSDADANLEKTVHKVLGLDGGETVDTQAAELAARRERYAKVSGVKAAVPPRYFWRLSSQNNIESADAQEHLIWLLNQVAPGRTISEMIKHGAQAYLSCFCAGNGRGGGPAISSTLLSALAEHGVELRFDFYTEEDEDSASSGSVH